MQFLKTFSFVALAAFFAAGCNNVEFQKTSAGVPFKVFTDNKGDSIKPEYIVRFEVIQKTKDTVLFSSYQQNAPQYLQVQPVSTGVTYTDIGGNIMEILPKLRKGDSVYIVQATDSLIQLNPDMTAQALKKGDELITTIRITEVYKTVEEANEAVTKDRVAQSDKRETESLEAFRKDTAAQNQLRTDNRIIEEYLSKNKIQTRKTDWGVYVQTINEGQGPKPKAGQYVKVKYTGKTLKGEVFDSGEFPMQVGMGGAIKGFEDGVRQLSKGGKAVIYIPSTLGYGPRGSGDKIKENENLIFELELLDISDTQGAQQQQHHEGDGHDH
jgi:FKBP-type peptidyl-prolyl cis-trans isomerase FkpA